MITKGIGDGLHGTPRYISGGSHYFINGNNLNNGKIQITNETNTVNLNSNNNSEKLFNEKTLLMSINGTIGNFARYNNENIMLGKSIAFIILEKDQRDFMFYQLQTPLIIRKISNNLTGSTIKNLGLKAIRNLEVLITSNEEEIKIGHYLRNIDNLITLHHRKYNVAKKRKC
jgi:type I restriction enzyme S subunit